MCDDGVGDHWPDLVTKCSAHRAGAVHRIEARRDEMVSYDVEYFDFPDPVGNSRATSAVSRWLAAYSRS